MTITIMSQITEVCQSAYYSSEQLVGIDGAGGPSNGIFQFQKCRLGAQYQQTFKYHHHEKSTVFKSIFPLKLTTSTCHWIISEIDQQECLDLNTSHIFAFGEASSCMNMTTNNAYILCNASLTWSYKSVTYVDVSHPNSELSRVKGMMKPH